MILKGLSPIRIKTVVLFKDFKSLFYITRIEFLEVIRGNLFPLFKPPSHCRTHTRQRNHYLEDSKSLQKEKMLVQCESKINKITFMDEELYDNLIEEYISTGSTS